MTGKEKHSKAQQRSAGGGPGRGCTHPPTRTLAHSHTHAPPRTLAHSHTRTLAHQAEERGFVAISHGEKEEDKRVYVFPDGKGPNQLESNFLRLGGSGLTIFPPTYLSIAHALSASRACALMETHNRDP